MEVDTLTHSMNFDEVEAYIITIKNNDISENMSARCQSSCEAIGQPYYVWDAFAVENDKIIYPDHAKDQDHYRFMKLYNDKLTLGETATILSHYSLWSHCIKIDRPIVILEHDSIMVKPYTHHEGFNQIHYLGNLQQLQEGRFNTFPIHAAATHNYHFICRAHAYAIDPFIAKQLVSHLIKFGLLAPADMLIRADLFNIVQNDFYAYDLPGETTITDRDANWGQHAKEIFSRFI